MSKELEWVANDYRKTEPHTVIWRSQFIEGDPKPLTNRDTVASLKAMGLIGLYKRV